MTTNTPVRNIACQLVLLITFELLASEVYGQCAAATNHPGNYTITANTTLSGVHNVAGTFTVNNGVTLFAGTGTCYELVINAQNIVITGTIDGSGRGPAGGSAGSGGSANIAETLGNNLTGAGTSRGLGGGAGAGTGGGLAGGNGTNGNYQVRDCGTLCVSGRDHGLYSGAGGGGGGGGGGHAGYGGWGANGAGASGINITAGFGGVTGSISGVGGGGGGTYGGIYGSATTNAIDWGSGGGGSGGGGAGFRAGTTGGAGGSGGARIVLNSSGDITISGTVRADGGNGGNGGNAGGYPLNNGYTCTLNDFNSCCLGDVTNFATGGGAGAGGGGGSGGGILIDGSGLINITGLLSVKGGNGGGPGDQSDCRTDPDNGGGGGGGRIKIFYNQGPCLLHTIAPAVTRTGGSGGSAGTDGSYHEGVKGTVAGLSAGVITAPAIASFCSSGNPATITSLAASGGGSSIAYQWQISNDNIGWSNIPGTNSQNYDPPTLIQTSFFRRLVSAGTCLDYPSNTVQISVSPPIALDLVIKVDISCTGENDGIVAVLGAGGTRTYEYSEDGVFYNSSNYFDNLSPATRTFYVRDTFGCIATQVVTTNEPAPLGVVVANTTDATCLGVNNGSIQFSGTGGRPPFNFSLDGGIPQTDSLFSNLTGKDYVVLVEDRNGCRIIDTVTLGNQTVITANITNVSDPSCFGFTDGSITLQGANGQAAYNYAINGGSAQPSGTFNGLNAGVYNFEVRDANTCRVDVSITLTEPLLLQTSTTQISTSCFGLSDGNATVIPTGGTIPYSYIWSTNPTQSTSVAQSIPAGQYAVTVTDANGCTESNNVFVLQPGDLFVTNEKMKDATCFGASNGRIDITSTGGVAPYTYQWSNGTIEEDLEDALAGTHSVTVTDSTGCVETYSATINQPQQLVATLVVSNATCYGAEDGSITTNVSGGTVPYSYLWQSFDTNQSVIGITAGNYSLIITDSSGCTLFKSAFVNEPDEIVVNVVSDKLDNTVVYGYTIVLTANVSPDANYVYQWNHSETLNIDSTSSVVATPLEQTTYVVEVTDADGCTSKDSITILVKVADGWGIPNAFSPNSDGVNDFFFTLKQLNFELASLQIFNRWGGKMYEGTGQWDGTSRGQIMPPGVYVYQAIIVNKISGFQILETGSVTLVK